MFSYIFKFNGYYEKDFERATVAISASNLNEAREKAIDYLREKYHYRLDKLIEAEVLRIAKYPNGEVIFDADLNCRD